MKEIERSVQFLILVILMVFVIIKLGDISHNLDRCAKVMNESNHIMVGVERGQVPGPGQFNKPDDSKTF